EIFFYGREFERGYEGGGGMGMLSYSPRKYSDSVTAYLRRACTSCSVAARQTFNSPVQPLPETKVLPSGEKVMDQALVRLPRCKATNSCPVATSHNLIVESSPLLAIRLPSGENAIGKTPPACPFKVDSSLRAATSQSLIVLSSLVVASNLP